TWRYYLATQGPLGATDADFVAAKFHEVYTTDLVNTVGNCTSRVTAMICKYFDGAIPEAARDGSRVIDGYDWNTIVGDLLTNARQSMDAFDLAGAIGAGVSVIRHVDGFINATEPFKLAKDEARREDLQAILYQCAEALRVASVLLSCVLPDKMAEFRAAIGEGAIEDELDEACAWGQLEPGRPVVKVALFPRVDAPMETATA
ncbi:MAG: class I tRNA ligase family protein, partial [Planctomycetota bacterium]